MANQIRVNREKTSLAKEILPPNPPIEAQSSRSAFHAHREPKQYMSFLLLGLLFAALLVTAFAVRKSSQLRSKAALNLRLGSVQIDPGIVIVEPNSKPIYMSTLAYDINGQPVYANVFYNWSISSSGSVGTLLLNPGNDKIATFIPLNKGTGDIVVTAKSSKRIVQHSIPVFVGVEPGSLINGSFETGSTIPQKWFRTNNSNEEDIRTDALSNDGRFSFKFKGNVEMKKGLSQTIPYSWGAGTRLYIGGWLKTLKLNKRGLSQISIIARYSDNSREKFTLVFPTGRSFDWTYRLGSFTLTKTTTSLLVKLEYSNQNGEGYFDAITLSTTQPLRAKATALQGQIVAAEETQ